MGVGSTTEDPLGARLLGKGLRNPLVSEGVC